MNAIKELWELFWWKMPSDKFNKALSIKRQTLTTEENKMLEKIIIRHYAVAFASLFVAFVCIITVLTLFILADSNGLQVHWTVTPILFVISITEFLVAKKKIQGVCRLLEIKI